MWPSLKAPLQACLARLSSSIERLKCRLDASKDPFPTLEGGAGAAFLLERRASVSVDVMHPDGRVTIRDGGAFASVALQVGRDLEATRGAAWRAVQQALDELAARNRIALQTSNGDAEYLLWIRRGDTYDLTIVQTLDAPWSTLHQLKSGAPIVPQAFVHHPAFRFYRLSQATGDLFDAYRNAYLSLECLVSDTEAKGSSEKELDWLKRVVGGPLAAAIPSGLPLLTTLEDVYLKGRNPIFHAKSGSTFYTPHGIEREEMQALFETLTLLLVCLLQYKFGSQSVCRWGSMSQDVHDAQAKATFDFDETVLSHNDERYAFPTSPTIQSTPRRFGQLWSRTSVPRPAKLECLSAIELRKAGGEWLRISMDEPIPLKGVTSISLELNLLQYHSRAPRPSLPQ